ncbi:ABC transporter substrate-binding protein [Pendulispora albinea]|uniref:ABC transporter substrate-binding protein n=1 Tax=Pendulispora albinea TaxID=2741071 RepID=A0ABZ2LSR2_9BACT
MHALAFIVMMAAAASGLCCQRSGNASAAPERDKSAGPEAERPIELIVSNDADTLDPRYAVDLVGLRTTRLLHAGLMRLDPDTLAPIPYLAEGVEWLGERAVRVTLKRDLRFHSGAPLTSRDVVATLRAFGSPAVGARHARAVEAIAEAREDGDGAVLITLKRPHGTLLTDLELPILRADEASSPPRPDGQLDGLGPYAVAERARGAITLEPRASVLGRAAHRVVIRAVHDENARALRLTAGRSDIALNVLAHGILPALAREPGLTVTSRAGANLTYLLARVDRGPLAKVEVRRALAQAIDRETIARTLLGGYAKPANTLIPPMHWAHHELPPLPYAPVDARAVLAGAGLHVSLLTSTDRSRFTLGRFVAQQWADAGAFADVQPLELGTLIARLNAGDFDLAILQIPELAEPNVLRVFLHGGSIPPAGSNRGRVRDPEVDALLDEGQRLTDRDARRAVYAKLEVRLRERLYVVPLWHEDQIAVVGTRAQAFAPSAEGRWLSLAALPP